jgi:hypothetical protein
MRQGLIIITVELETDTVLSSIIRSKQEWLSARYAVTPLRQQIESDGIAIWMKICKR